MGEKNGRRNTIWVVLGLSYISMGGYITWEMLDDVHYMYGLGNLVLLVSFLGGGLLTNFIASTLTTSLKSQISLATFA